MDGPSKASLPKFKCFVSLRLFDRDEVLDFPEADGVRHADGFVGGVGFRCTKALDLEPVAKVGGVEDRIGGIAGDIERQLGLPGLRRGISLAQIRVEVGRYALCRI
jgi:hypothetical protein